MVSVIVPAHDEANTIARLLGRLTTSPDDERNSGRDGGPELSVLVVCNGCTDGTAAIARGFPGVRVIETPVPSKREALRLGDREAGDDFPRIYVDADVELDRDDLLALAAAVGEPEVLAAAPSRTIPRAGVSLPVRWYYDIWERLPNVQHGIFGRGVIAVSRAGYRRIAELPLLMSDDLAMSSAFADGERRVVAQARVVVHPPRTWQDLMRRRIRAATGTAQAYDGRAALRTDSRTGRQDLVDVIRRQPSLAVKLPVFLAVAVLARRRAAAAVRRGDHDTWLRDESSRQIAPEP